MWWLGKVPLRRCYLNWEPIEENTRGGSESFSGRGAQQVQRPCVFEKLNGDR